MPMLAILGAAVLVALTLFPFTNAYSNPRRETENSTIAAFVYATDSGNVTFAVTTVKDVGDLYFHLEGPADYSWISVGTGEEMDGSLMWIIYRSRDGNGVTLSTRTVDGHVEPSYNDKVDCQVNSGNGIINGIVQINGQDTYAVNGHCKNINNDSYSRRRDNDNADKDSGNINFASSDQNFIFALGPTGKDINSDSKSATIRRHTLYGEFKMDLSRVTVQTSASVDQEELSDVGSWQNSNAQLDDGVTNDHDWSGPVHAALMCGAFVLLFPIGVVFLRVLERVRWHAWMQGFGLVIAVIGVGVGIYLGREYNHSKNVNSAHQILGLIIVIVAIGQFILGLSHHSLFKRRQRPTSLGRAHLYIGPFILIVGAVNGFLGFDFADDEDDNIWYGVIVGVVSVALILTLFWVRRRKRKQAIRKENMRMDDGLRERYQDQNGVPLSDYPTDGRQTEQPRNFV
ncbi:CBD9-like protein [Lojkania enalia]|uniref:CBD9-like protein n=1 Tax=Lojkania enalia TaxID=147567 RepID=A0A9P4MY78_9PLEO|nr:CBD9-like protein [Didymosphaeria enalia]